MCCFDFGGLKCATSFFRSEHAACVAFPTLAAIKAYVSVHGFSPSNSAISKSSHCSRWLRSFCSTSGVRFLGKKNPLLLWSASFQVSSVLQGAPSQWPWQGRRLCSLQGIPRLRAGVPIPSRANIGAIAFLKNNFRLFEDIGYDFSFVGCERFHGVVLSEKFTGHFDFAG